MSIYRCLTFVWFTFLYIGASLLLGLHFYIQVSDLCLVYNSIYRRLTLEAVDFAVSVVDHCVQYPCHVVLTTRREVLVVGAVAFRCAGVHDKVPLVPSWCTERPGVMLKDKDSIPSKAAKSPT
jgi:hypothetical protein